MNLRRRLLLALLLYVTVDLSLPAMPGAFVFDAAGSVESIQARRDGSAAEPILLPAPSNETAPMATPVRVAAAPVPPARRAAPHATLARRRPGAVADAARSSEDPH